LQFAILKNHPQIRDPRSAIRNSTEVNLLTQVIQAAVTAAGGAIRTVARRFASTSASAPKKCP